MEMSWQRRSRKRRRGHSRYPSSSAHEESPVEHRLDIPGYYYDSVKDTYFRLEPGSSQPPPSFHPPPSFEKKTQPRTSVGDIQNVLGILQQQSLGRLSADARLRFVLRTVRQLPETPTPWTMEHPEQVLIRPDASSLIVIYREPAVGLAQIVGQTLEWENRTSPQLTCPIEFYRCADGLNVQLAGSQTAEGDDILSVRNPKFGETCPARICFSRVDFSNLSMSELFLVTMDKIVKKGSRTSPGFRSSHIVCVSWNPRLQALFVGGDREALMYRVDQEVTESVGRGKACSLAVSGDTTYVGRKAEVLLYDVRTGFRQAATTIEINGGAVIKQLSAIKDGRYLLAEDQVGTVYQCDPRYPERAIATMRNRTPDSIRCIPFQLDEQEDILTSTIPGHGAHLWDLRTNTLLRCQPESDELLTAAFKRKWDSVLLFCREEIRVAPLC